MTQALRMICDWVPCYLKVSRRDLKNERHSGLRGCHLVTSVMATAAEATLCLTTWFSGNGAMDRQGPDLAQVMSRIEIVPFWQQGFFSRSLSPERADTSFSKFECGP